MYYFFFTNLKEFSLTHLGKFFELNSKESKMKQKKVNILCSIVTLIIVVIFLNLISCQQKKENKLVEVSEETNPFFENSVDRDLEQIKKDGVLRALVVYSSTSYFLYRGQAMGFEYELLTQLAK